MQCGSFWRRHGDVLAVIALGGALGSLARWALASVLPEAARLPWATFVENLSGAFALGLLLVFVLEVWPPSRYARPFLAVGVLGGYTTFSTYMLDTRNLLAVGEVAAASAYLLGTLGLGLLAVELGAAAGRLVVARGRRR